MPGVATMSPVPLMTAMVVAGVHLVLRVLVAGVHGVRLDIVVRHGREAALAGNALRDMVLMSLVGVGSLRHGLCVLVCRMMLVVHLIIFRYTPWG